MEIKKSKNKVKIIFEYLCKSVNYITITNEDIQKLNLRIFLKDGDEFLGEDIRLITLNEKEDYEP